MLHLDYKPKVDDSVFVARTADVIGHVTIGKDSSVWFQTVLRGDVMPIAIGERSNVQDGTIIHGSLNKAQTRVGNGVTIGHKVILHGCTIEDEVLIGMGACVMDNAVIPKHCLVGAGALVTENEKFEEGVLILGTPAKRVRALKSEELSFIKSNAEHYVKYANSYKTNSHKTNSHKMDSSKIDSYKTRKVNYYE